MPFRSRLALGLAVVAISLASGCTDDGGTTDTTFPTTAVQEPTTAQETTTTVAGTTSTSIVVDTGDLPEPLAGQVVELIGVTEQLRELRFLEPPEITVVTSEELMQRVQDSLREDIEDIDADESLYILLGLLPEGSDLLQLYTDLYGEQVAGFYDLEARELVVPADETELTPLQKTTLVHELTHALTDQHYDVGPKLMALIDEDRFDEASAYRAVSEGDATLTEILYIQSLGLEEQQSILAETFAVDTTVLDSVPQFLQEALFFPYREGFTFVQRLYELGGFEEIGRAYQDPPVSTEQIYTPQDYRRDAPLEVDHPDLRIDGYEQVYESVWGELGFRLMIEQVLGPREAAVDGWGGDRYGVWHDGSEVAMALTYRGDTEADAGELAQALHDYVSTAMAVDQSEEADGGVVYTGDDYAYIAVSGDTLVFVVASDPAAGAGLAISHPGP